MFRKSRPVIRRYEHEKDAGFLWAAKESFGLSDVAQEQFVPAIAKLLGGFSLLWVIEDEHKGFKAGRGLIGIVGIKTDGWAYMPEVRFFGWATKRNILRATVAFFQLVRHQKDVGVCEVRTTRKDFAYMKHIEKYGLLYVRGKIPKGSPKGDVFIFSIEGKK